jgi:ornithine lipid ester-linked acyl 2-hydroxylase
MEGALFYVLECEILQKQQAMSKNGLVSAYISKLEAHTEILPHRGDTNGIIRCHLGLTVPGKLPDCGFQAGYDQRSWEEGKLLLFNDAARHLAFNQTEKERVILMLDVVRPEFLHQKNRICLTVLASLLWQLLASKITLLKKSPGFFKRSVHAILMLKVTFLMPIHRLVKFF